MPWQEHKEHSRISNRIRDGVGLLGIRIFTDALAVTQPLAHDLECQTPAQALGIIMHLLGRASYYLDLNAAVSLFCHTS